MAVWTAGLIAWFVFPFFAPKEWMHGNPHPRAMRALELCELALLGVVTVLLLLPEPGGTSRRTVISRILAVLLSSLIFYLFWPIYHF